MMGRYPVLFASLLAVLLTVLPSGARAAGFFVGASVGRADLDESFGQIEVPEDRLDLDLNADSPGWSLYAGYEIGRYLGLRAGYIDFSTFDDVLDLALPGAPFIDVDLDGWTLGVDGYVPVTDWLRLTGHAGIIRWNASVQFNLAGIDRSEDGSDVFYGAGIEFGLTDFLVLGVSYIRYEIADADVDYAAAQVRYRF